MTPNTGIVLCHQPKTTQYRGLNPHKISAGTSMVAQKEQNNSEASLELPMT